MGIALLLAFLPLTAARAEVVINEILYNAPEDRDDIQWIELHNTGAQAVDLSSWTIDEGKGFVFPAGTKIDAHGYLVVALNPEAFAKLYNTPALGPLKRPLKRGSERIELQNAKGKRVDVARYKDRAPWPVSADGYSASLERICPTAAGEEPENWTASPLPTSAPKPSGTPGKLNAGFSAVPPPTIGRVTATPEDLSPGKLLQIEAEVKGKGGLQGVMLLYQVFTGGVDGKETELPMSRDGSGRYRASIPAQPANTLVRYRIRAIGKSGALRLYPDPNDLRPTLSAYVHEQWEKAAIPFAIVLRTGADRPASPGADPLVQPVFGGPGGFRRFGGPPGGPGPNQPPGEGGLGRGLTSPPAPPRRGEGSTAPGGLPPGGAPPGEGGPGLAPPPPGGPGAGGPGPGTGFGRGGFRGGFMGRDAPSPPRPPRGASAFVWVDQQTGKATLYDHVNVIPRDRGRMYRGFKVFFHKDRTLNGMSAVNLVMEGREPALLAEALAFDLYRRAGNAAPVTEFVRLWLDGRMIGFHLMVERPNRSFLRRNQLNDEGNLYKLIWYGQGLIGQHAKKTNTQQGHEDVLEIIDRLLKSKGEEQWKLIEEKFSVPQVATYFAVNTVLSHWDGFFNNYFAYHDTHGSKKWEMYPWDQDNTWGMFGFGGFRSEVFFDMPLTFGMDGDRPPGAPAPPAGQEPGAPLRFNFGGGRGFGGFGGGFGRGGAGWWRPPGHFSGPLLANPQFRQVFLGRTKQILEQVYTQEVYFPLIDEMAERVREDAILRAKARGQDTETATRMLARSVEQLKSHLLKRRQFLLEQPELVALGPAGSTVAAR
jgi:spore coat protein CotH